MVIPPIIAGKAAQGATKPLTGDIYVRRWTTTAKKGKRKGQAVEHEVRVNAVTAAVAAVGVGLAALAGGAALWMTQQKLGKTGEKKQLIRWIRVYDPVVETVKIVDSPAYNETKTVVNWHEEEGYYDTVANATATCPVDGSSVPAAGEWIIDTATGKKIWSTQAYDRWVAIHAQHWPSMEWTYSSGQVWIQTRPAGYYPSFMTIHHDEVSHTEDRITKGGRTVIMTQRGIPIKTYEGVRIAHEDILGPRLYSQYGFNKMLVNDRSGEDRLGKYREWINQYAHLSKESIGLQGREGFGLGGML